MTKMFELIYDKINKTKTTHGSKLLKQIIFGESDKNYDLRDVVISVKENSTLKHNIYELLNDFQTCDIDEKLKNVNYSSNFLNFSFTKTIINSIHSYSFIFLIIIYFLIYMVMYNVITSNNNLNASVLDFAKHIFIYHKMFFKNITSKISSDDSLNDISADFFAIFCFAAQIIILCDVGFNAFRHAKQKSSSKQIHEHLRDFVNIADDIIDNDVFVKDVILREKTKIAIKSINNSIKGTHNVNNLTKTIAKHIKCINKYVAQIDVQLMLSDMVIYHGFCVPEFLDETENTKISIQNMFCPISSKSDDKHIVKNNFTVDDKNTFIIGGSCGKGKTYFLNSIYLCVWMSHVLDISPCENIKLQHYDFILNIKQNSSSIVDIEQVINIKDIISANSDKNILLVNDNNLCKNLSFQENVAILYSLYDLFSKNKNLISISTTNNNPSYICDTADKTAQIINFDELGVIKTNENAKSGVHNFKLNAITILESKYDLNDTFIKNAMLKLRTIPK